MKNLNQLMARAIQRMRDSRSDRYEVDRAFSIERPIENSYNDEFILFWFEDRVGRLLRDGCGQDWKLLTCHGYGDKAKSFLKAIADDPFAQTICLEKNFYV